MAGATSMHWRGLTITPARAVTCWGLFFDEINKFFWWPLHLSGYVLVVVPLPPFVGLYLLRASGVTVSVGPGWVPAVLAGILVLVVTLRASEPDRQLRRDLSGARQN